LPEYTLIHADIYDALHEIHDGTFDSVIADAPYGLAITKNSGSNWDTSSIAFHAALWSELRRVTKPGGILAAFGHPVPLIARPALSKTLAGACSTRSPG
jgi:DNA modification methylase